MSAKILLLLWVSCAGLVVAVVRRPHSWVGLFVASPLDSLCGISWCHESEGGGFHFRSSSNILLPGSEYTVSSALRTYLPFLGDNQG